MNWFNEWKEKLAVSLRSKKTRLTAFVLLLIFIPEAAVLLFIKSRPFRLIFAVFLLAIFMPNDRLLLVLLLFGLTAWFALTETLPKDFDWKPLLSQLKILLDDFNFKAFFEKFDVKGFVKKFDFKPLLILAGFVFTGLFLYGFSLYDSYKVTTYYETTPLQMAKVQDGTYESTAQGKKGPITVQVVVKNSKIESITTTSHQETASIGGDAITKLTEKILAQNSAKVDTITGATWTSNGFILAVQQALWKGVPDRKRLSWIAQFVFGVISNKFGKEVFNGLAIAFIVLLFFDYAFQSVLVRGTGQTLNCMNCQTCVGACPVKVVEDQPYPMQMVLDSRLGDYAKVARFAAFCVGCSKCVGKCPVGISPPSVAGAAIIEWRKQLEEKNNAE